MSASFNDLPEEIQEHLKSLTQLFGLPHNDESYDKLAEGWMEKQTCFEKEVAERGMKEIDHLPVDDTRGAVALTYSGSLVLLGPVIDGVRKVAYNSISARQDVPETAMQEDSKLAKDVLIDEPLELEVGPVQKTSSIFKIAVCNYDLAPIEQEELLENVTVFLVDQFVQVNKDLVSKAD